MGFTFVDDVTRALIGSAPAGATLAGYTTGSGGIAWGAADWAAHPTAIRIDQDWQATDTTADVLDVEGGAATPPECGPWAIKARANFAANKRPGQRLPAIYCSLSQVNTIVTAMRAGGVTGGVGLWIADWMNSAALAEGMIGTTYGGFKVIGVQYRNAGNYDMDVFDTGWFANRSGQLTVFPLKQGMSDIAATGLIHTLQANLNRWATKLGVPASALLVVDGAYGPLTTGAVTLAQLFFGQRGVPAGVCDQAMFTMLAGAVPVGPLPPAAPTGLKAVTASSGSHATLKWNGVAAAKSYEYQLEWYKPKFGWVLLLTKTVSTVSDTQLLSAGTKFRYRVSSGTWSGWAEFTTAA
jgi:hypothetical protein